MKITRKVEISYNYFEPGTLVEPTSSRCSLDTHINGEPALYRVVRCIEPKFNDDTATVFVEGRETGVSTEYLRPVYVNIRVSLNVDGTALYWLLRSGETSENYVKISAEKALHLITHGRVPIQISSYDPYETVPNFYRSKANTKTNGVVLNQLYGTQ